VTAVDLKTEAVETVVAALPGGPHKAVGMDLNDLAAHAPLIAESAAEFGDVVGIVLAAGVLKREAFTEVSEKAWDWQVDTNLKATFFLSRAAGEYFRAAGIKGSITTFTSISAVTGGVSPAPAYGASKGGVITVTYALARQYGPDGIRVNTICPGFIDTPMQRSGFSAATQAGVDAIPMKRMAAPEEVASVAVFLASNHASYVSGALMNVSGGAYMG
jgi:NAD(P)-dependent dehydrogenase (short-subunit alcohol dehydrogenase family)